MKKAELILANFDARIPKIEIKPKNMESKVEGGEYIIIAKQVRVER